MVDNNPLPALPRNLEGSAVQTLLERFYGKHAYPLWHHDHHARVC